MIKVLVQLWSRLRVTGEESTSKLTHVAIGRIQVLVRYWTGGLWLLLWSVVGQEYHQILATGPLRGQECKMQTEPEGGEGEGE